MPIRDILLLCDAAKINDFRIDTGVSFAKDLKAHLTGLYLVPHPIMPIYDGALSAPIPYVAKEELKRGRKIAKEIGATLKAKAAQHQVDCDWVTLDGMDPHSILDLARYHDIVIVPQGYSRLGETLTQKFDDYLAIHLGRPLLVLPTRKTSYGLPKRIMIAWNESHEAARAVHDALRLLQIAKNVQVITVTKKASDERTSMLSSDDLRTYLSRHDIKTEVLTEDCSIKGTGAAILQSAIEHEADLIVMGAYGHTRLTEAILGGATNYMLKHSTIPLLLSH